MYYFDLISANYLEKRDIELETGDIVNMMIYDTAGQEEYGALTRSHFHGAGAAILTNSRLSSFFLITIGVTFNAGNVTLSFINSS